MYYSELLFILKITKTINLKSYKNDTPEGTQFFIII